VPNIPAKYWYCDSDDNVLSCCKLPGFVTVTGRDVLCVMLVGLRLCQVAMLARVTRLIAVCAGGCKHCDVFRLVDLR